MAKSDQAVLSASAILVLALAFGGCATSRPTRAASATQVSAPIATGPDASIAHQRMSGNEAVAYKDLRTTFSSGNMDEAIQKMSFFEKKFPKSAQTPHVRNLHGLAYLLSKKPADATLQFKRAIEAGAKLPNFTQYVLYNLATAQFDSGQIDEAQQSLNQIQMDSVDRDNRIKVHYLKARVLQKRGMALEASREGLAASRLFALMHRSENRQIHDIFVPLLEQTLKEISNIAALETLYKEYEDSPLADSVLFRMGSQEIFIGNSGSGEFHLRALMSRYPQSIYYSRASELVHTSQASAVVDSGAIGVLLPMKGRFAKFGSNTLQSIALAFKTFDQSAPDSRFTLVVEDSGEEPDHAIKALDRLVLKHHVVAVIGPLLSKGIDQVTQRAQELGVPLISLARSTGVTNEYVFQAGLTLQMQASEIARYAVQKLKYKRFAMVFPKDKVGETSAQYFWNAVESMGGEVVGVESYAPSETDFRQVVDRLSGLYYTEARNRELEALAKEREENNIRRKTRKTERFFNLRPIVDYEAVFIPDEPKIAGQLLPTFAYRDVDKIKFLGTSAWNSAEFTSRVQNYAENASFVDAFYPDSTAPSVRKFVEEYKASFGQDPTAMEAIAYDAAKVLEYTLSRASNPNRNEVKSDLMRLRNYSGVTGDISYQDGQFTRNLRILTVHSGKISEVQAN